MPLAVNEEGNHDATGSRLLPRLPSARRDARPRTHDQQITSYCSYRKLTLAKTYSDIDFSGYNHSRSRPGLSALIDARHRYAAVVVPKLSGFGRSLAR